MEEKEKTKILWDTPGNIAYDRKQSPPTYVVAFVFTRGLIPPRYGNTVIETENPITTAADFDAIADYVRNLVYEEVGPYGIDGGILTILNIMRLPI